MLVLSRRIGERICIDNQVWITILEVRSGIVRIGIDAPRHVTVHREEVARKISNEERGKEKHE